MIKTTEDLDRFYNIEGNEIYNIDGIVFYFTTKIRDIESILEGLYNDRDILYQEVESLRDDYNSI